MPKKYNHTALGRWILKNFFKIDLDTLTSEQRASLSQLHDARVERQQLHEAVEAKETEIGSLKHQLENAEKAVDAYKHQLESSETNLSSVKKQRDQLDERHKKLQNDLDGFKQERLALKSQASDYERQITELKSTIKQKDKELADAISAQDALRAHIASFEKQLIEKQSDIDLAAKLRQELTKNNAKLEGEMVGLKRQAETHRKIIDGQQADIDNLTKEKKDLEAILASYKEEIERLRQEQAPQAIMDKYEADIEDIKKIVQTLEDNIQSRDRQIEDLKSQLADNEKRLADAIKENEALNQHVSELSTTQQDAEQEDDRNLNDQVKILAQELSEARSNIQLLTEELDSSRDRIKKLEATIAASSRDNDANLEIYKARLHEKDEKISELKDRIKELEAQLAELRLLLSENGNATEEDTTLSIKVETTNEHSSVLSQQPVVDESSSYNDDVAPSDLPTIAEDGSSVGERAIKAVINWETGERIEADEFFRRSKEEITTLSRRLEIISKTGDAPLFICEKCSQPVKISKITRSRGETLFFTHCHRDVPCEWRKENEAALKPVIILDDTEIKTAKAEKSRYEHLREIIYKSLKNQEILGHDIRDIEVEKRIKSDTSRSWRLFDVYAKWQGLEVVFKLQRSTDYLRYLVGLDEFCKQEKAFIIWVFGSDSATSYSYLLENNYQATLFDNRSCVFILDREAEKASNESGELKLKCNWLIDGKHWYHTIARTNSNGVLVSLDDLCFDDTETYKPYFKDKTNAPDIEANEIVELKPGVFKFRIKAFWGIYTNGTQSECKYKDIYLDGKGHIVAIIDDIPEDRRGYLSDDGTEIPTTKEEISHGIFVLNIFERLCLADKSNRPISKYYDAIKYWCDDRLIIQRDSWLGIIDFHGREIAEPQYDKLRIVNNNKARVTDYRGKYSIDNDGNPIPDEIIPLNGNYQKVKLLNKWGIMNAKGKLIVDYQYNEIATFRNRFFGFTDACSIIKLENVERFNYRIPFWARFVGTSSKCHLLFNCAGVELTMIKNSNKGIKREVGKEYLVSLINIIRNESSSMTYFIATWEDKSKGMKFVPTDFDSDYKVGQRLTGKVVKVSSNQIRKRVFVELDDKRQTYVNFSRKDQNGNQYSNGVSITLEKIGYDPFYEITKWNVIK